MINRFFIPISTICLVSFFLNGCGSLIPMPGEPPKRFILDSLSIQESEAVSKKRKKQLIVDTPVVFSPLDNNRIALKASHNEIDYYASVEWGERLGNLIQQSLIYSLQNSQLFISVTHSSEGIIPDYNLKTEVRQFYINREGAYPIAVIEYFCQLVKSIDREVKANKIILQEIPLKDETTLEVVSALNKAHLEATRLLLSWLQEKESHSSL